MTLKDVAGIELWVILLECQLVLRLQGRETDGTVYSFPVRLSMTVRDSSRLSSAAGSSLPMTSSKDDEYPDESAV